MQEEKVTRGELMLDDAEGGAAGEATPNDKSIRLSDHFTVKKLLRFTLPSIVMMIFTSIYGVVDGLFVSNFVGKTAFSAVNFIMPYLMILGAIGFMFGAGGSALVSKTLGQGRVEKANRRFSFIVYFTIFSGALLGLLGIFTLRPVAILLGAEGQMLEDSVLYGTIILLALPAFMLQMEFQSFFVTAEKPKLGLFSTLAAGIANMLLDALFVGLFRWGLVGAACATAISQLLGGVIPILYFLRKNSSLLRLTKAGWDGRTLWKVCVNGSSELMSNVSMSLVGMLYNIQLLKYAGQDGIAAYGVLMYVTFAFLSIYIGYIVGCAPVIGYHYGAKNSLELKSLLRKSLAIIGVSSLAMVALSLALAVPLSKLFVGYDENLYTLTRNGFYIYSLSFLFSGFAIFLSGFFTALNDGVTSAIVSFLRTLVFQVAAVLILPLLWQVNGIWMSVVVAEVLAVLVGLVFLFAKQKKFQY